MNVIALQENKIISIDERKNINEDIDGNGINGQAYEPRNGIGSDEACRLIFIIELTSRRAAGISPVDA